MSETLSLRHLKSRARRRAGLESRVSKPVPRVSKPRKSRKRAPRRGDPIAAELRQARYAEHGRTVDIHAVESELEREASRFYVTYPAPRVHHPKREVVYINQPRFRGEGEIEMKSLTGADAVLARIKPKPSIADLVDEQMAAPKFGARPRVTPKTRPAEFPTSRLTPLETGLDKMLKLWNLRAQDKD